MTGPRGATGIHAGWWRSPQSAASPASGARAAAADAGLRRCRVEHRIRGETRVLARGVVALPTAGELAPFAGRLRLDGAGGEVVLVDEASGAEVGRLAVARTR